MINVGPSPEAGISAVPVYLDKFTEWNPPVFQVWMGSGFIQLKSSSLVGLLYLLNNKCQMKYQQLNETLPVCFSLVFGGDKHPTIRCIHLSFRGLRWHGECRVANKTNLHVLASGAGNPCRYKENRQTPYRRTLVGEQVWTQNL